MSVRTGSSDTIAYVAEAGDHDAESREESKESNGAWKEPTTCAASDDQAPRPPSITARQLLQLLCAFVIFFNTWGLLLAFGVLQTFYKQQLLSQISNSQLAWPSTICAFLADIVGLVAGPLFDHGYFRYLLVSGSLLQAFGLMMLSISDKYYNVLITHGFLVGIGMGLLYTPASAAISVEFTGKKRARITGLVAAGSGIGGVFYTIVLQKLLPAVGFPWAIRIVAFIVLATYLASGGILRYRPRELQSKSRWFDVSAFRDTRFMLAVLGIFFCSIAYYMPILFMPQIALSLTPDLRQTDIDLYLLTISNASSVVGRLMAGLIASFLGPIETCVLGTVFSSVLLFVWVLTRTIASSIVWALLWGFTSSVIIALPSAMIPLLCPSLEVVGLRTGIYWIGAATGFLVGGPIGASLTETDSSDAPWLRLQLFSGAVMVVGSLCYIPAIYHVRRKK